MKWAMSIVAALLLIGLTYAGYIFFKAGFHQQLHMFRSPVMDTVPPELPELENGAVLIFSKTNGFRHHEAIAAGNPALAELAKTWGRDSYVTENAAIFNAGQLESFDLVIWNNASGTLLTEDQRSALQEFIESGGGFIGIHAAGDSSHGEWPWYTSTVLCADMTMHPVRQQIQKAVLLPDTSHPVTQFLPEQWQRADEWYSFASSPAARTTVLVRIDEDSYDPERWAMGDDHPLVWTHEVGRGRVFYSALGHTPESYSEPLHLALLANAMQWVTGGLIVGEPNAAP